ncbi:uncharacterized protein MCAP_0864 isoform X1 [Anabrus simplex]|uniref:uncharacterized protein MCAP_0864 isoform X1 n=1 Tax=Anabrus simplex TaxID=316456 RepID=UPI0035A3A8C5
MDMQQMKNKKYYLNGDSGSSTQTIQSLQICALLDPQFLSSVKSSKRCTTLSQEWKSHNDDHIDLDISSVNEDISFYDSEFKESRPELDKYSSSWPGHKKPLESSLQSLSQGSIMSKTLLYLKSDIKERENETKDKSNPEDEKTLSIVKADLDISSVNEDTSFYESEFKESGPELDKYSSSLPGHKKPLESSLKSLSQGSILSKILLSLKRDIKERESETKEKSNPEDLDISSVNEDVSFYDSEFKESGPELDKYSSSWPGHKKPLESSLKSLSEGSIMSKILLSLESDIKERKNETKEKSNPEDEKTISVVKADLDISSVNEDISFYDSEFKESGPELDKYSSSWPGHKKPLESSLKSLSQGSILSKILLSSKRDIKERENETKGKSNPEDEKTISVVKADLKMIDAYEELRLQDDGNSVPEVEYSSSWPKLNKTVQFTFKNLSQPEMPSRKNMIEKSRVFPINVESIVRMHPNPSQNDGDNYVY